MENGEGKSVSFVVIPSDLHNEVIDQEFESCVPNLDSAVLCQLSQVGDLDKMLSGRSKRRGSSKRRSRYSPDSGLDKTKDSSDTSAEEFFLKVEARDPKSGQTFRSNLISASNVEVSKTIQFTRKNVRFTPKKIPKEPDSDCDANLQEDSGFQSFLDSTSCHEAGGLSEISRAATPSRPVTRHSNSKEKSRSKFHPKSSLVRRVKSVKSPGSKRSQFPDNSVFDGDKVFDETVPSSPSLKKSDKNTVESIVRKHNQWQKRLRLQSSSSNTSVNDSSFKSRGSFVIETRPLQSTEPVVLISDCEDGRILSLEERKITKSIDEIFVHDDHDSGGTPSPISRRTRSSATTSSTVWKTSAPMKVDELADSDADKSEPIKPSQAKKNYGRIIDDDTTETEAISPQTRSFDTGLNNRKKVEQRKFSASGIVRKTSQPERRVATRNPSKTDKKTDADIEDWIEEIFGAEYRTDSVVVPADVNAPGPQCSDSVFIPNAPTESVGISDDVGAPKAQLPSINIAPIPVQQRWKRKRFAPPSYDDVIRHKAMRLATNDNVVRRRQSPSTNGEISSGEINNEINPAESGENVTNETHNVGSDVEGTNMDKTRLRPPKEDRNVFRQFRAELAGKRRKLTENADQVVPEEITEEVVRERESGGTCDVAVQVELCCHDIVVISSDEGMSKPCASTKPRKCSRQLNRSRKRLFHGDLTDYCMDKFCDPELRQKLSKAKVTFHSTDERELVTENSTVHEYDEFEFSTEDQVAEKITLPKSRKRKVPTKFIDDGMVLTSAKLAVNTKDGSSYLINQSDDLDFNPEQVLDMTLGETKLEDTVIKKKTDSVLSRTGNATKKVSVPNSGPVQTTEAQRDSDGESSSQCSLGVSLKRMKPIPNRIVDSASHSRVNVENKSRKANGNKRQMSKRKIYPKKSSARIRERRKLYDEEWRPNRERKRNNRKKVQKTRRLIQPKKQMKAKRKKDPALEATDDVLPKDNLEMLNENTPKEHEIFSLDEKLNKDTDWLTAIDEEIEQKANEISNVPSPPHGDVTREEADVVDSGRLSEDETVIKSENIQEEQCVVMSEKLEEKDTVVKAENVMWSENVEEEADVSKSENLEANSLPAKLENLEANSLPLKSENLEVDDLPWTPSDFLSNLTEKDYEDIIFSVPKLEKNDETEELSIGDSLELLNLGNLSDSDNSSYWLTDSQQS